MEALKRKWNSSRGASILLALLFFLVCMMAGASILMAAASNAGKVKSNQEEQQKYLTLTSALNLVIDELERVTYVGKYDYTMDSCGHPTAWGDEGEEIAWEHEFDRTYTRQDGEMSSTWVGGAGSVLPLLSDMDSIFSQARNFRVPDEILTDQYTYVYNNTSFLGSYTLELTVDLTDDEKEIYGGLGDTVKIVVELDSTTGVITLTAKLRDDPTYTNLEAVLNPNGDLSELLALSNSASETTVNLTEPAITWTLDHISKKETADE